MASLSSCNSDKFWNKVVRSEGCWLWSGAVDRQGYGRVYVPGQRAYVRAHRLSWFLTNGSIDHALLICHHCDNPRCVRPSHLFQGTNCDNVEDRNNKGRQASGSRNGAHLHKDRVRAGILRFLATRQGQGPRPPFGEGNGNSKLTASSVRALRLEWQQGDASQSDLGLKYGVSQSLVSRVLRGLSWTHVDAAHQEEEAPCSRN